MATVSNKSVSVQTDVIHSTSFYSSFFQHQSAITAGSSDGSISYRTRQYWNFRYIVIFLLKFCW